MHLLDEYPSPVLAEKSLSEIISASLRSYIEKIQRIDLTQDVVINARTRPDTDKSVARFFCNGTKCFGSTNLLPILKSPFSI